MENAVIHFLGDTVLLAGPVEFFYTSALKTSLFEREHYIRPSLRPPSSAEYDSGRGAIQVSILKPDFFWMNRVWGKPAISCSAGLGFGQPTRLPGHFLPTLVNKGGCIMILLPCPVSKYSDILGSPQQKEFEMGTKSGHAHLQCLRSRSGGDSDKQEPTFSSGRGFHICCIRGVLAPQRNAVCIVGAICMIVSILRHDS